MGIGCAFGGSGSLGLLRIPSVLVSTPILTDNVTFSLDDRSRHPMRYVTHVKRNPILKDFIGKLAHRAAPATS